MNMANKQDTKSNIHKTISLKPSLAWTLEDYKAHNEDPPECVIQGKTEAEIMDREEAIDWIVETIRFLRVLLEDYPDRADTQKQIFELDLAYLCALGKITESEQEDLTTEENYTFYEKKQS
jgi:predicted RNase H-like HicB family nuclease